MSSNMIFRLWLSRAPGGTGGAVKCVFAYRDGSQSECHKTDGYSSEL